MLNPAKGRTIISLKIMVPIVMIRNPMSYPHRKFYHPRRSEPIQTKKGEKTYATFLARLLTFLVIAREIAL